MPLSQSERDEKQSKENYCKLWVLHGDSDSAAQTSRSTNQTNMSPRPSYCTIDTDSQQFLSKSTSILSKHVDEDFMSRSKAEEKLQREYLSNLLKQLENEKHESIKDVTQNSKFLVPEEKHSRFPHLKRSNRSKSETFLELNQIPLATESRKSHHGPNLLTLASNRLKEQTSSAHINSSYRKLSSIIQNNSIGKMNLNTLSNVYNQGIGSTKKKIDRNLLSK